MQGVVEPNATVTVTTETSANAFSALTTKTVSVKASKNGTFKLKVPFTQFNGQLLKTTAKDLVGNKSKATSTKVADRTPPNKPTVNPISNITSAVTGKAESGSYIYVKKGSKIVGKGKTSSSGKFSIKVSKNKTGTTLTVYSADAAKNRSKTVTSKVVKAPKTPTINSITRKTVKVSGKTDPYTTIYIKKGSKVLAKGKTTKKGVYSLRIPKQKAGQTLTVVAKSNQGVYSYTRKIKVK
jgi:cell wall-associated protease